MTDSSFPLSRLRWSLLCLLVLCGTNEAWAQSVQPKPPAKVLQAVEEAIDLNRQRHMDFQVNTPWEILHGLLALRENYALKDGDRMVNALHHLSNGARYKGKLWFEVTQHGGRAHPYNGTPYDFEGHVNQTLAIIAMSNPPLTHQFVVEGGRTVSMADMVKHAQKMVNTKEETTWTLWFLTHYLDQDTQWVNAQGQRWSMESLVRIQTAASPIGAPCGGTHSLFALAYARNSYLQKHGELRGAWLEADQKLQRYIAAAQSMQNRDGSFATQFFKARGYSNEFNERIKSSGHMLEWLMMALPRKRLDEAWVLRGVERLAQDLLNNAQNEAECGPLYHSLHALILYRQRVAPDLSPPVPAELATNSGARPLPTGPVVSLRPDNSATPENVENLPEAGKPPVSVPPTELAMTAKPESAIPPTPNPAPGTSSTANPAPSIKPRTATSEVAVTPAPTEKPAEVTMPPVAMPEVMVPTPKSTVVVETNKPQPSSTPATQAAPGEPRPLQTAERPNTPKPAEVGIRIEPRELPTTQMAAKPPAPTPSPTADPARPTEESSSFPDDLPTTTDAWVRALQAVTKSIQEESKPAMPKEPGELPQVPMPLPIIKEAAAAPTAQEPRPVGAPPSLMPILKRPRPELGETPENLVPSVRPIKDETPSSEAAHPFTDDQFLTPPPQSGS